MSGSMPRARFTRNGRRSENHENECPTQTDKAQQIMKTPIEYTIVAVPFHADAATHEELVRKVNEKLNSGYELYGPPFLSEEMMYQAMTKPILPN